MEIKNIMLNYIDFYYLCQDEGWTDDNIEDFDELSIFEGDPDIIQLNGNRGYFFHHVGTDTVWYWFDGYDDETHVPEILRAFYEKRLIKEYWPNVQSWKWFDSHSGIAYRGGFGYVYTIYPLRIAS